MNYLAKMENKSSKSQRRLGELMKIPVYSRSPVNRVDNITISVSVDIFIPTPTSTKTTLSTLYLAENLNMTPLSKNDPTCAKYWVIFKQFNILINIL